jgi:hypothetical protein
MCFPFVICLVLGNEFLFLGLQPYSASANRICPNEIKLIIEITSAQAPDSGVSLSRGSFHFPPKILHLGDFYAQGPGRLTARQ